MPKIQYVSKNFRGKSLVIIDQANQIIEDYQAQGLNLTLRQLYYRFVATGLLPNTQREYSRLGGIITDARLAGMIDWEAIEDRGRRLNSISHWDTPGSIISSAASSYRLDKWEGQPYRVEVWVEKQALEAVIEGAAKPLDVPSFACKGYTSASEMWRASQRLIEYQSAGQKPVIIHLGDHDPSGLDMTRDVRDRMFTFGLDMEVNRIALNMDQVQAHNPPPNPTKLTDSRADGYIAKFGSSSWELDALDPPVLKKLIQDTILSYCDKTLYDQIKDQEAEEKDLLNDVAANWDAVVNSLTNQ